MSRVDFPQNATVTLYVQFPYSIIIGTPGKDAQKTFKQVLSLLQGHILHWTLKKITFRMSICPPTILIFTLVIHD